MSFNHFDERATPTLRDARATATLPMTPAIPEDLLGGRILTGDVPDFALMAGISAPCMPSEEPQ